MRGHAYLTLVLLSWFLGPLRNRSPGTTGAAILRFDGTARAVYIRKPSHRREHAPRKPLAVLRAGFGPVQVRLRGQRVEIKVLFDTSPETKDSLGVQLRDPRFGNSQNLTDFLQGQTFVVVEPDGRSFPAPAAVE